MPLVHVGFHDFALHGLPVVGDLVELGDLGLEGVASQLELLSLDGLVLLVRRQVLLVDEPLRLPVRLHPLNLDSQLVHVFMGKEDSLDLAGLSLLLAFEVLRVPLVVVGCFECVSSSVLVEAVRRTGPPVFWRNVGDARVVLIVLTQVDQFLDLPSILCVDLPQGLLLPLHVHLQPPLVEQRQM